MTKRGYTQESVERALHHHLLMGALRDVSPPGGGRRTWKVDLPQLGIVELTTPQAYGLCVGLAAGEHAYRLVPARIDITLWPQTNGVQVHQHSETDGSDEPQVWNG